MVLLELLLLVVLSAASLGPGMQLKLLVIRLTILGKHLHNDKNSSNSTNSSSSSSSS